VFLEQARKRLQAEIKGLDLTIHDTKLFVSARHAWHIFHHRLTEADGHVRIRGGYNLLQFALLSRQTVALGYSAFCDLFTQKEWKGYEYLNDIKWWWDASFGYSKARAQGTGWVQELVSRLTHSEDTVGWPEALS
jgi:hypothetical protein